MAPNPLPDKLPPKAFKASRAMEKTSIEATDSDFIAAMLEQYCEEGKAKSSGFGKLESVLSGLAAKSRGSGSSSHEHCRFTPIELLAALQVELIATEARLNFDYLGFSRTCMSWLSKFIEASISKVPDVNDAQVGPAAAYYLLMGAASVNAESRCDNTPPAPLGSKVAKDISSTPFAAGAAVLQQALGTELSKKYSQAAFNLSSGRLRKENRPAPAIRPEKVIPEAAIQDFLAKLGPGASIASSRRMVEIYDPTGNVKKMDQIFNTRTWRPFIAPLMPDGISKDMVVVVQESGQNMTDIAEGYSHPQLHLINAAWDKTDRSEDYIDYGEAIEQERKRRERVFRKS